MVGDPQATHQQLLDALRLELETDGILGVREWPIAPPAAGWAVGVAEPDAPHAPRAKSPPPTAPVGASEAEGLLRVLNQDHVVGCRKCGLARTRTQTVFGQGNPQARLVFVGEAPGFEEDRSGLAFVGAAGQLLTKMIETGMGIPRDEVFICNVLKCRPPNNRTPSTDEIAACSPYLFEQLQIINPEVIVALGAPAAQTLLETRDSIGRLRGRFHDFRLTADRTIPLMPTYHPAYLLRSPHEKAKAWEDLKLVMGRLGLPLPG